MFCMLHDITNFCIVSVHRLTQGTSLSLTRPHSAIVSLRPTPSVTPRRPQSSRARLTTSHSAPVLHTGHHIEPGGPLSANRGGMAVSHSQSFYKYVSLSVCWYKCSDVSVI